MTRHVLAVLHDTAGGVSTTLVSLAGEPEGHGDLERAAGVPLAPAGPDLTGGDVVLHRCRGPWGAEATAAGDHALDPLVEVAVAEEVGQAPVPVSRAPWYLRGWEAGVLPWVDEVLSGVGRERSGPPQVVHSWAVAHVLRVPTETEPVWLKACAAHFAAEPVATSWLSHRHPEAVPHVLAFDRARGLLLMDPLPAAPATEQDLPAVGVSLARLQLASVPHRDEVAGLGMPHRGLPGTVDRFAQVVDDGVEIGLLAPLVRSRLRAALPWVADQCAELASRGVPETLCHGDLHLGNVARGPGGPVLYDWSDACWGHPFLDAVHLPTVGAPGSTGRDWQAGYLDVWRAGWADAELGAALELAVVVDRVFQAVTYEDLQCSLEPAARTVLRGVQARILTRVAELAGGVS